MFKARLKQGPFFFFSVELCFDTLALTIASPREVASLAWETLQAVELPKHSAGAPRPCKYSPGQANACPKPMALIKTKYKEQRLQIPLFVSFTELLLPIKLSSGCFSLFFTASSKPGQILSPAICPRVCFDAFVSCLQRLNSSVTFIRPQATTVVHKR